jgi:hypothetical protein
VIQRFVTALAGIGAVVGIACVDMSAPSGAASISSLQLPSPFVVAGDSMRDSAGVAKAITVIGYDGNGAPLEGVEFQVFITDTARAAHLSTANVLIGDAIGATRVLGQVGNLQTPVVAIPITYAPARLVAGTRPDTVRPNVTAADSAASMDGKPMVVLVRSADDSASAGTIVRYRIVREPVRNPNATSSPVFIADDSNKPTSVDTADAGGASRRLVVIGRFLGDPDVIGANRRPDSAIVEATATYKGRPLANSPLRIVVPIRVQP